MATLETLWRAESEKSFQARVVKAAEALGWLVSHQYLSIKSPAGWPDLVLARPPRIIFAEVKRERGVISAAQKTWLDTLAACGLVAYVWRPSNWDEIVELLR